ncbi:MAG TPA: hypothetical protein VK464_23925, partial [Symbiobacteriaceae bacterium]|nr:hypothetical protein [Symbiobacteriaceae bacterium]
IVDFIHSLPARILATIGDLGRLLFDKGRSIIQGLIDGMMAMIEPFKRALDLFTSTIGNFFGRSPAKEGPLSGQGWMEPRGRRLIKALNDGMRSEAKTLSSTMTEATTNIALGGVTLNFHGQQPNEADARRMGTAAAMSLTTQLAIRDTRLAIRSQ